MSTVERSRSATVPPLVAGQRMDRATFHERYEAMPPDARFELIGGVVVMPSPVGAGHGQYVINLGTWVNFFRKGLPGLSGGVDATVMVDDQSEPQPDIHLRIKPEYGGQIRNEGKYLAGTPELVIEVSASSKGIDLGPKLEDYRRGGVIEYLVVTLEPEEIHWFAHREDRFEPLSPGADGYYRSEVFPGLWLDPVALVGDDLNGLIATLERGLATPEHAAFVDQLNSRRRHTSV